MSCSTLPPDDLSALLDGALPELDQVRVENHLAGCSECRERREQIADVRTLLRTMEDVDPGVSADLPSRVSAAAKASGGTVRPAPVPDLRILKGVFAFGIFCLVFAYWLAGAWKVWTEVGGFTLPWRKIVGSSPLKAAPKPPVPKPTAPDPEQPPTRAEQSERTTVWTVECWSEDSLTGEKLKAALEGATSKVKDENLPEKDGLVGIRLKVTASGDDAKKVGKVLERFQDDYAGAVRRWKVSSESR